MTRWHRQTTDKYGEGRGEGGGVKAGKAVRKRRNSKRKEALKRRKTNDFNMKKTNAVIKQYIARKCMGPSFAGKFVQIVHRTTYK